MLTLTEESGLRDILEDFSDSDLLSLTDTVTKKFVNVTDRYAAIQTILSCSGKPSDVLRRQKVTKRVLFGYLLKRKSYVSPLCSKNDLIKMCLVEWNSREEYKSNDYENNSTATDLQQNRFSWLSDMGIQFVAWFFPLYNSLQGFGPEHFWTDCKLIGELKTPKDKQEAIAVGASDVVSFLRSLIADDKFYFDANTSGDSVTGEQDPHGLIRIIVSGVVHQISNCIGVFDCLFGLVKVPDYDLWKIKWIHMKIQVNNTTSGNLAPVSQAPSICL